MLLPAALSMQHRQVFERRHDIQLLDCMCLTSVRDILILLCFALTVFLNLMVDLFGGIAHYLCSVSIQWPGIIHCLKVTFIYKYGF